ncbi:AbgT family transporter (plasmid) [Cetobacterium somerae]|uniref:AbgT family transporter n=1 Tax=Cetobacterium somerae TaxID=188913 RepID=UPI002E7C313F|nr:AbgT family transporter [Cetobacterium somerae]WVJ02278.1 AbgT family transporter [Cetobacterium somerae]
MSKVESESIVLKKESTGIANKILDLFEKVGNKLPDSVTIFVTLCFLILVISYFSNKFNVTAIHPITKESIAVNNLLSKANLKQLLVEMINVFQTYPPLGVVLVAMIGIGVADKSGLLETLLNSVMVKVPKGVVYYAVVILGLIFTGIGDAGFVVLPPLAALIFLKLNKNPIIGVLLAYAGAAIGFCSGLFVSLNDILITSFTIPAAQTLDPSFMRSPAMTIFFNMLNACLQMFIITLVTKKFIEPRFPFDESLSKDDDEEIGDLEKKGLKYAGYSLAIYFLLVLSLTIGKSAFLRDSSGSLVSVKSPLMGGLIIIMMLAFMIPGVVFGKVTRKIKNDKDIVKMVGQSLGEMGGYIFIVFVAAQFLNLFGKSNLGIVLAIKGAEKLSQTSLSGIPLMIMFIFLVGFINLFIGSASAKWAILSPIFIPMFMLLDYDPSLTQIAYRIGDSSTNMISPLFPYLPLILAVCKKYDKNFGIGTLVANMIPYAVATLLGSISLLVIFVMLEFSLGI